MAILKSEALMMGRGIVIVAREVGQEFYPMIDDLLLMRVVSSDFELSEIL